MRNLSLALALLPIALALGVPTPNAAASPDVLDSDADEVSEALSSVVEVDASEPEPTVQIAPARASAPPAAPRGRSFTARVTAYAHGTRTASGTPVRWGVVAVDPKVIALGSRVMIEGFDNVFVAEDTGGGIRGNQVDIYFPDAASALRFGVQTRTVTVMP